MHKFATISLLFLMGLLRFASAGTVNLAWDAPTSGGTPTGYEVHYGTASGVYSQAVDTGLARTASIGGLTDGQTYYFVALAYNDSAEREGPYSNEVNAIPTSQPPADTTPPTASITSPANNATVQRKAVVPITVNASDNVGVTRVEFYVTLVGGSTTQPCQPDTSSPYSCAWTVPPAGGNKHYLLQAKAYDAAGNVGASPMVEVVAQ